MTTLIVLLALFAFLLLVVAYMIRSTSAAAAVGRRSLTSPPNAGPPLRSPHLAPAASAAPSRDSRTRHRSGKPPSADGQPAARTCDGSTRPRLRGVFHQVAFFLAVPAAISVALTTHGSVARAAGTTFACSVAAMFGVSSLFHRGSWTPRAARRLGQLDHAMIYGLIAGTYAPIGLLVVQPGWRLPVLTTVWGGACLAAAIKLAWPSPPTWLPAGVAIALGWVAVIVLPQIVAGIGFAGSAWLLAGGIAYTVGAIVYVRQRPNPAPASFGYHELFHALVVVAAACQYSTIVFYVLPRG